MHPEFDKMSVSYIYWVDAVYWNTYTTYVHVMSIVLH